MQISNIVLESVIASTSNEVIVTNRSTHLCSMHWYVWILKHDLVILIITLKLVVLHQMTWA